MQSSNDSNERTAIQQQINAQTDGQLESTRRMLGLVAQSQEVGTTTMIMLDEQGEKLKRIENGVDNVHVGMDEADKHINELNKCCGLCVLPWNRARRGRRPLSNSSTTFTSERSSPVTSEPKARATGEDGMPSGGYITRITNDDREVEMDDNLQLVSSYLGNLKNIALDMNDTIETQNKHIDRITDKTGAGADRVAKANKSTQDILRRA